MKVVLGIGNRGTKYLNTRHNIGFMILDTMAQKYKLEYNSSSNYYYAGGTIGTSPFVLLKPTTYVNLSGIAAREIVDELGIDASDLLVVVDDLNLDSGRIRIRKAGGDGGHNGLHSIIYHLETDKFPRLRFGIGNKFNDGEMADYVLGRFSEKEKDFIAPMMDFSINLIENFITGGVTDMLNHFSKESNTINKIFQKPEGN